MSSPWPFELRMLNSVYGLAREEASVHNHATPGFVLGSVTIKIILCSAE